MERENGAQTAIGPRIVGILGSVRPGNYTAMAMRLVQDQIEETKGFSFQLIDPSTLDLPMPGRGVSEDATLIQEAVAGATGVVLATT